MSQWIDGRAIVAGNRVSSLDTMTSSLFEDGQEINVILHTHMYED